MKAIKKISELEKLTELIDSSNVIIEENGVAKLFPATNIGGTGSWNDLTDKPFYPPNVYYEWNEDTVYETRVALPEAGGGFARYFAKISDDSPSYDFLIGKCINSAANIGGKTKVDIRPITSDDIMPGDGFYNIQELFVIVSADSVDLNGLVLTKGIWCLDDWVAVQFLYVKIQDMGKMIDESVIPNTIARTSDLKHYTYGTEDLTAGVSKLATGTLYFVYE